MDRYERRVNKLRRLVEKDGGPAAFARKRSRKDADKPIDPAFVSQILNGHRTFGEKAVKSMEERAGLPPGYFDASDDNEANAEDVGRPRTMRPVKIKGYAKLGDDGYYEETECDGWVDSYSPDPDAYGLRVKGDSMHPAIRNGSVVVIEPRGQLVPGEYVAIALFSGKKMVKELVFYRADEIVVESVNGNHRQTIERNEIENIHPVSAVVSPSKWRAE